MAKKKTEVVFEPVVEQAPTEAHEPKQLLLTREEVLELQLHEERGRAADATIKLRAIERDLLLAQIDAKGQLNSLLTEIKSNSAKFSEAKTNLLELRAKIEKRLEISSLSDYAYDEVTGTLQKADS